MKKSILASAVSAAVLGALVFAGSGQAATKDKVKPEAAKPTPAFSWTTVVNNTDFMPTRGCEVDNTKCRLFNSYNQPSVNERGLVVIRARSRGGPGDTGGHGEEHEAGATLTNPDDGSDVGGGSGTEHGNQPVHGIYTRDMSVAGRPIVRILDRKTEVPAPNNAHYPPSNPLLTTFIETPSFPRIDSRSDTIATRGNHQPVWVYEVGTDPETGEPIETRAGTTGIYTNPFGNLITGASKLGAVPGFEFFAVPGLEVQTPTAFDVFPGAPAVTGGNTIVFKGNFTVDNVGRTGVFYRELQDAPIVLAEGTELAPAAGISDAVLIANNVQTVIPGTNPPVVFGSTSPPSAANGKVVFAGFDNEESPTLGGLYLAPLQPTPDLTTLVGIGGRVPGESASDTFNGLGEGGAFDGRFVGFWGAWGEQTKTVRLYCSTEGNKDRIDYCNQELVCEGTVEPIGDPDSTCEGAGDERRCYQEREVPVHQGVFVHDTRTGQTLPIAKTGSGFDEFLFWNYSGKTPCTGGGHSEEGAEDDGEAARWRSSAFVAVSARGSGATFNAAFKARKGALADKVWVNPVDGIYLQKWPGEGQSIQTVLDTTMDGQAVDPEAPAGSIITELGIERESLRGRWLAVNASMAPPPVEVEEGEEEDSMAGVYITRVK